jgi:hypothetical protein
VLGRQLRSPLLILLAVTACASFFVGERSDAVIIGVILLASVGLGCVNEYRAEKAAEASTAGGAMARSFSRSSGRSQARPVSARRWVAVPGAESGFDLAMTELTDAGGHRFVVRADGPDHARPRPAAVAGRQPRVPALGRQSRYRQWITHKLGT